MISAENGIPQIIYKNKILLTLLTGYEEWLTEKIATVKHTNGKDWWVLFINRKNGNFIKLLVTQDGATISEQQIPEFQNDAPKPRDLTGEMVFSVQGDRLAGIFIDKGLYLFDFDRCTGEIKVNKKFPIYYDTNFNTYCMPYGIAFSPNGAYLYETVMTDSFFQINLTTNARNFLFKQPKVTPNIQLGQLELAPNGKIYMNVQCSGINMDTIADCTHLGVIHYPDKPYPYCQFERLGLSLGNNIGNLGLPNMPVYAPALPFAHAGWSQAICDGDSVQIGAPRQSCQYYKWKPAVGLSDTAAADPKAAPLVTTVYTLTTYIDGSDEISVDSVTIFVHPFTNASISAAPDTFSGPPFTVHFKALGIDTTNFLFAWNFGDGQNANGATTSHTYDAIAGYPVKLYLQDFSGACKDTLTYNLKLTLITAKDELKTKENSFRIYPNPADESVTIEHDYPNASIEIFTPLGKIVHSQSAPKPKTTVDLRRLAKGIYYVRLVTNINQFLAIKKLIIH